MPLPDGRKTLTNEEVVELLNKQAEELRSAVSSISAEPTVYQYYGTATDNATKISSHEENLNVALDALKKIADGKTMDLEATQVYAYHVLKQIERNM